MADDAPPVKATATRPTKEPAGQTSLPNNAPPATATQPTASTDQSPTVRGMNEDAKKKLETEGTALLAAVLSHSAFTRAQLKTRTSCLKERLYVARSFKIASRIKRSPQFRFRLRGAQFIAEA